MYQAGSIVTIQAPSKILIFSLASLFFSARRVALLRVACSSIISLYSASPQDSSSFFVCLFLVILIFLVGVLRSRTWYVDI